MTFLNPSKLEIFKLIEIMFVIGILINLLSYLIRFIIIAGKKHTKTFLRTVKEGFTKKLFLENSLSISLLLTSFSVFWYMLRISGKLEPMKVSEAFQKNTVLTCFILTAGILLIAYSIFISVLNIRKLKKLTPALGLLGLWNSMDGLGDALGKGILLKPVTELSRFFRKTLIQSEIANAFVSTLIPVILEYIYKIMIVFSLVYLIRGKLIFLF